jgi:hypothetical protein
MLALLTVAWFLPHCVDLSSASSLVHSVASVSCALSVLLCERLRFLGEPDQLFHCHSLLFVVEIARFTRHLLLVRCVVSKARSGSFAFFNSPGVVVG